MQEVDGVGTLEASRTWLNRDPRGTPTIRVGLESLTGSRIEARLHGIPSTPLPESLQAVAQHRLGSAGAGSAQAERGVGERPHGQGNGRLQPFNIQTPSSSDLTWLLQEDAGKGRDNDHHPKGVRAGLSRLTLPGTPDRPELGNRTGQRMRRASGEDR